MKKKWLWILPILIINLSGCSMPFGIGEEEPSVEETPPPTPSPPPEGTKFLRDEYGSVDSAISLIEEFASINATYEEYEAVMADWFLYKTIDESENLQNYGYGKIGYLAESQEMKVTSSFNINSHESDVPGFANCALMLTNEGSDWNDWYNGILTKYQSSDCRVAEIKEDSVYECFLPNGESVKVGKMEDDGPYGGHSWIIATRSSLTFVNNEQTVSGGDISGGNVSGGDIAVEPTIEPSTDPTTEPVEDNLSIESGIQDVNVLYDSIIKLGTEKYKKENFRDYMSTYENGINPSYSWDAYDESATLNIVQYSLAGTEYVGDIDWQYYGGDINTYMITMSIESPLFTEEFLAPLDEMFTNNGYGKDENGSVLLISNESGTSSITLETGKISITIEIKGE